MKDIIFVHGMFQNPTSWKNGVGYFSQTGYNCTVPARPFHEGKPSALRANPPQGLGHLHPDDITAQNYKAYTDTGSVTDFKEFAGRSHFICNEPGGEEVAGYVCQRIRAQEQTTDNLTYIQQSI